MKKLIPLFLVSILFLINTSLSVSESNIPVYMKRSDLNNSVKYIAGDREMVNPGKIYYKSPYVYVVERYKGIHIVNNTDPRNPIKEGFITVPGCLDIAAKGNIIYLDNAVDLVAFDLDTRQVTERIKNILPEPGTNRTLYYTDNDDMIIVEWRNRLSK